MATDQDPIREQLIEARRNQILDAAKIIHKGCLQTFKRLLKSQVGPSLIIKHKIFPAVTEKIYMSVYHGIQHQSKVILLFTFCLHLRR